MRAPAVGPWRTPSAMDGPPPGSPPRAGDALIGRALGPYRVDARLGAGGMGVVYRAHDTRLGRPVAVKLLPATLARDAGAHARLLREARTVAALDHRHLASVYDVGETDDGRLFLAMAFYDGETLEDRLARAPLDAERATRLALQIADGLGAAHRAGIVHRDVKPANVMLVGDAEAPSVRVLDFGIAATEDAALTQPGHSAGTALYMSPEQMRGEPADARSDVWALGAVLYEMLSGRRPFRGAYAAAIGYAVLHEDPPPLDGVDPDLAVVVQRCLAKDPADRYASMDAVAEALRGEPDRPDGAPAHRPDGAPARRPTGRWLAVAAAVGVLALAALLAWPRDGLADSRRLVVLPFRADGADARALAAGLVETTTGALTALPPLREHISVVPASEVPDAMTPTEAYEALGATLVVEGTVATEGEAVRVTLSVVEVGPDGATQAGTRSIGDASGSAFALQDAAALEVAHLLRITVGEADRSALAAGDTDDPRANELYLRGRGVLRDQLSIDDLDRARGLFADAIEIDGAFALARAGLAMAEWETFRRTDDPVWARRALATAQRALDADASAVEPHVAQAVILRGQGEPARALRAIDRAIAIDPSSADAHRRRAKILADLGRTDEAERAFRRAVALAPDFWRTYNSLGFFYNDVGRPADAEAQLRLGLERSPANLSLLTNLGVSAWLRGDFEAAARASSEILRLDSLDELAAYNLSVNRLYLGDVSGAVRAARRAVRLQPDGIDMHHLLGKTLWWAPGGRDEARRAFARTVQLGRARLAVSRDPLTMVAMAEAFALRGRPDSARAWLGDAEALVTPDAVGVQDAFAIGTANEIAGDRADALAWIGRALAQGYGEAQLARSPWLTDLRQDPLTASLPRPRTTP